MGLCLPYLDGQDPNAAIYSVTLTWSEAERSTSLFVKEQHPTILGNGLSYETAVLATQSIWKWLEFRSRESCGL